MIPSRERACRFDAWALAGLTLSWSAPALAQDSSIWPTRTIQIVVPYTPGTGADILARILGPKLAERWKVGVVTDNRAGASGNIGADLVAKSAPDGYTLLCTATSFSTTPALHPQLPYDPIKSFEPVALLATNVATVLVNPQLPVTSARELIELAKREPGKLYYASPGNGTPQHLAMELLKLQAHIDLVHVPYKATGGALTDLVAGHVQAMVAPPQTAAPYLPRGGRRPPGGKGRRRRPRAPQPAAPAAIGRPQPRSGNPPPPGRPPGR